MKRINEHTIRSTIATVWEASPTIQEWDGETVHVQIPTLQINQISEISGKWPADIIVV